MKYKVVLKKVHLQLKKETFRGTKTPSTLLESIIKVIKGIRNYLYDSVS